MLPLSPTFVTTHTNIHWKYIHGCETMSGVHTRRNVSTPRDQLRYLISPSFTLIHLPSLSVKAYQSLLSLITPREHRQRK